MLLAAARAVVFVALAAAVAHAHTSFTTLFVNGVDQGDGTCVRQPADPQTATFPLVNLASRDMICGRNGLVPVAFTCPAPAGSTLTFAFRTHPDGSAPGALDPSHRGPCAVYMRQVVQTDNNDDLSHGWFKIYDDGYDNSTGLWCTDRLIAAKGLLSVALPRGLPMGAYLVRPELLSLHEAAPPASNPQFYVGCAQVFVTAAAEAEAKAASAAPTRLHIPAAYEATIPGYVHPGDAAVAFDLYDPVFPYTPPGPPVPPVFSGDALPSTKKTTGDSNSGLTLLAAPHQAAIAAAAAAAAAGVALVPLLGAACLVKNANWCGVEVPAYTTAAGCWDASADCFRQEAACYAAAPPTGHANCDVWDRKCMAIQAACNAADAAGGASVVGPPHAGEPLQAVEAAVPGPIPAPGAAARRTYVSRRRRGRKG